MTGRNACPTQYDAVLKAARWSHKDTSRFRVNGDGPLIPKILMELIQAQSPEQIESARQLFEEYASWLEISLCFQNFDKELAGLPGDYAPPSGRLLLAIDGADVMGCVALRNIADGVGEMKRLYVRPAFRGRGLGRTLTEKLIAEVKQIGYASLRLDTLPGKMDQAITMYHALGFYEIAPYYRNPVEGATFMELSLAQVS
jgi:putative acetyltransferase